MKHIVKMLIALPALLLLAISCDVHEFPALPETLPVGIRMEYNAEMERREYAWYSSDKAGARATKGGVLIDTVDMTQTKGTMRYIIRAQVLNQHGDPSGMYTEYTFNRKLSEGYNCEVTLDLAPAEYNITVWSELLSEEMTEPYYDTRDFSGIILKTHAANTDYRDAFRGTHPLTITASIMEQEQQNITIQMRRPLAKYEFITNDLHEFITKAHAQLKSATVDICDYKVKFLYPTYMPNTYSIFTDKPIDASTGNGFDSEIIKLNEHEATIGFDYVFVNGQDAVVTVVIGIYDKQGKQLSLTNPIDVPLRRSRHTIMKGSFLMQDAKGGVTIDPSFENDFNIVI